MAGQRNKKHMYPISGGGKAPLGLANLGNTCFMNSALQCLASTRHLPTKLDVFGSGKDIHTILKEENGETVITVVNLEEEDEKQTEDEKYIGQSQNGVGDGDGPWSAFSDISDLSSPLQITLKIGPDTMTGRLRHTFNQVRKRENAENDDSGEATTQLNYGYSSNSYWNAFSPGEVLELIGKNFRKGAQHDSHELLRFLVDMMKKDQTKAFRQAIMDKFGVKKKGEDSDPKFVELVKALDKKVKHKTFVDEVFGGELMTKQTCLTCNHVKRSHEQFLDLSLPLRVFKHSDVAPTERKPARKSIWGDEDEPSIMKSLDECLVHFFEPELLTGSNVVECENCHKINLAKIEAGVSPEEVFPSLVSSEKSSSQSSPSTGRKKNNKASKREEKKKKRQSRQAKIKNRVKSTDAESSSTIPTTVEFATTNDADGTENSEMEPEPPLLEPAVPLENLTLTKMDDEERDADPDEEGCAAEDVDFDLPSAADGVCGNVSDDDEDQPNLTLGLDLPSYDKFGGFSVQQLIDEDIPAQEYELVNEKPATADEGFSEGENSMSVDNEARHTTSQGPSASSSRNSLTDSDDTSNSKSSTSNDDGQKMDLESRIPKVTRRPCSREQCIVNPPLCLTVHFKRFQMSHLGYPSKVNGFVSYPMMLNLTKFCSESEKDILDEEGEVVYSLYGVVEHSGTMNWGHYVAYVKEYDNWYFISDGSVRSCPTKDAENVEAYMLFYRRVRGDEKKIIESEPERPPEQQQPLLIQSNNNQLPDIDESWDDPTPDPDQYSSTSIKSNSIFQNASSSISLRRQEVVDDPIKFAGPIVLSMDGKYEDPIAISLDEKYEDAIALSHQDGEFGADPLALSQDGEFRADPIAISQDQEFEAEDSNFDDLKPISQEDIDNILPTISMDDVLPTVSTDDATRDLDMPLL